MHRYFSLSLIGLFYCPCWFPIVKKSNKSTLLHLPKTIFATLQKLSLVLHGNHPFHFKKALSGLDSSHYILNDPKFMKFLCIHGIQNLYKENFVFIFNLLCYAL